MPAKERLSEYVIDALPITVFLLQVVIAGKIQKSCTSTEGQIRHRPEEVPSKYSFIVGKLKFSMLYV